MIFFGEVNRPSPLQGDCPILHVLASRPGPMENVMQGYQMALFVPNMIILVLVSERENQI
jgi:hypothetical protein